jgi:hypothetical protein
MDTYPDICVYFSSFSLASTSVFMFFFIAIIFCVNKLMMGDWRKLHNYELHNLYSSPKVIRMIKSRRMRWSGHVARMGKRKNACTSQKERDH